MSAVRYDCLAFSNVDQLRVCRPGRVKTLGDQIGQVKFGCRQAIEFYFSSSLAFGEEIQMLQLVRQKRPSLSEFYPFRRERKNDDDDDDDNNNNNNKNNRASRGEEDETRFPHLLRYSRATFASA